MKKLTAADGIPSAALSLNRHLLHRFCYSSIHHWSDYTDWRDYPDCPNKNGCWDYADSHNHPTAVAYVCNLKLRVLYS